MSDDFTPDPDFDARARAAGRELRQPPPPDGLRSLQRSRRNRRMAQAGGSLAVVALGVGGIVAVTRGGDDGTVTTADSTIATLPDTVSPTTPATAPPDTAPGSAPVTATGTTPGTVAPADPIAQATSVAATPDGIMLGLPDDTWVASPYAEPAQGPAYLAGPYVVHQPDSIDRWSLNEVPIRVITQNGATEWTAPGPVYGDDGSPRYRVLDAGIVEGAPMMLVSQSDYASPETADARLLLVGLDDGEVRDLGSFGGWESGVSQARLAGNRIVALTTASVATYLELIELDGTVTASHELTSDVRWHLSLGTDGTGYAFTTSWDGADWSLDSVALMLGDIGTLPMAFALPADFEEVTGGCHFPYFTGVQLWCFGPNGPAAVHIGDPQVWVPTDDLPDGVLTWRVGLPPAVEEPPAATGVPATSPHTAPTSEPETASPTTMPAEVPAVPTVWVGEKLAGYYDGAGRFVAATSADEVPDGVLGEPIEVHSPGGDVVTATPTTEGCSSVYLSPSPGWGIWATVGAPLAPSPDTNVGTAPDPDVIDAVNRDLAALGLETLRPRIFTGGPLSADGTVDAYVVNFGFGDESPTWIATWDDATGEFTTIEGDTDPSNALAMGMPLAQYLDLDADGNWEIVFSVGDAWGVRELATNESIVFGPAHPCPDLPIP